MSRSTDVRIHGHATSINVRKVLWACEEIGIAAVRVDGGVKSPAGLVPVLEDGAATVWESNTIVRYLAASRGRVDLLPGDPLARARVEQWMDWQASDFNNTWRYAFQALVRRHPAYTDARAIETSLQQVAAAVGVVDAQLATTGAYVVSSSFTVADIAIGLSVHRWYALPVDKPAHAAVAAYYERLCTRPGFARYGRDGGP